MPQQKYKNQSPASITLFNLKKYLKEHTQQEKWRGEYP
jgi:hypothetical protein